ncbi:hypothetical protein G9A89_020860 [Geosiphon pyriformis]|nr:hypothetical protein G9A89_020860 [Geosiphon pyriformis]
MANTLAFKVGSNNLACSSCFGDSLKYAKFEREEGQEGRTKKKRREKGRKGDEKMEGKE